MERPAQRPCQHGDVDVPDAHGAGPKEIGQPRRDKSDKTISHDHHLAPVPAVHQRAGERPQDHTGEYGH